MRLIRDLKDEKTPDERGRALRGDSGDSMGLSAEELAGIDALLGSPDADANAVAAIRHQFPRLSITRCDPSDLGAETPFREYERFDLHLVDGSSHCWRLTENLDEATGLVVVARRPVA